MTKWEPGNSFVIRKSTFVVRYSFTLIFAPLFTIAGYTSIIVAADLYEKNLVENIGFCTPYVHLHLWLLRQSAQPSRGAASAKHSQFVFSCADVVLYDVAVHGLRSLCDQIFK